MESEIKLNNLKQKFPQLSETNKQYILGLAVGLKYSQKNNSKENKLTEENNMTYLKQNNI